MEVKFPTRKCTFILGGEARTQLADLCEASGMEGREVVEALVQHAHDNLQALRLRDQSDDAQTGDPAPVDPTEAAGDPA